MRNLFQDRNLSHVRVLGGGELVIVLTFTLVIPFVLSIFALLTERVQFLKLGIKL